MQLEQRNFDINQIERNALGFRNSRTILGDLTELRTSICENGLMNPPIVWVNDDDQGASRVILLAGHRRFQAILDERDSRGEDGPAFFDTISCGVYDGPIEGAIALNISENIQREDLNYADMCESVANLNERIGNQTETSRLLNISQPQVSILCSTYHGLCPEGLEALRPSLNKNSSPRNKKMCLQNFSMSFADFEIFRERVLAIGGVLEKDEVNVEALLVEIETLTIDAGLQINLVAALRETINKSEELGDVMQLQEVLELYSDYRLSVDLMRERRAAVVKDLDRLSKEKKRTNFILATSRMEEADEAIQTLQSLDFDRFEREAIHRYKVLSGKDKDERPGYIQSLKDEIGALSKYFEALNHLTVEGDVISIRLGSVTIVLSPEEVRIDGDIGSLKTYTTGLKIEKPTGSSRRRRRAIYHSEEQESPEEKE